MDFREVVFSFKYKWKLQRWRRTKLYTYSTKVQCHMKDIGRDGISALEEGRVFVEEPRRFNERSPITCSTSGDNMFVVSSSVFVFWITSLKVYSCTAQIFLHILFEHVAAFLCQKPYVKIDNPTANKWISSTSIHQI